MVLVTCESLQLVTWHLSSPVSWSDCLSRDCDEGILSTGEFQDVTS